MGILLQEGLGDTIRISLTPEPGGDRTQEVKVAQELLQTMGFRSFAPQVAACPGCGRTTSTVFQELARDIETYLAKSMPEWRAVYPGVERLNVAVMGCIVNGPGESKHANIGISLPGTGEAPAAPVFVDGVKTVTLRGPRIAEDFKALVNDYIVKRYGAEPAGGGIGERMARPPLPPFTAETAAQKARMAEDAWNTRDPARVALAYSENSRWRNRAEFFSRPPCDRGVSDPQVEPRARLSADQGTLGLS